MPLLEKHLFVKESTIPGAGQGLFTDIDIPKGTKIIQYTGRVSTWTKADHQEGLNAYIYYMSDDHVIDASKRKKSLGRYANDARGMKKIKGLLNNSIYVEEGLKVYIESTKAIPAGGEILVSYGAEYWQVIKKNYEELEEEKKAAEEEMQAKEAKKKEKKAKKKSDKKKKSGDKKKSDKKSK